jgi:hypothetical protein
MHNEELMSYMVRGGISPRRAKRILSEFHDHHADIVAERLELGDSPAAAYEQADRRLGSPLSLVVRMLMRPELQSWAKRRPWAAYALMPLLGYFVLFLLAAACIVGLFEALGDYGSAEVLASTSSFILRYCVPVAAAVLLIREAAQRRETSVWPWVGLLLLCTLGAMSNFEFTAHNASHEGNITIGFGFNDEEELQIALRAVVTALLGAMPYLWLKRRGGVAT